MESKIFITNLGVKRPQDEVYDCIIIGGGPAGLASAIYALREKMSVLLLDKFIPGGQIALTDTIENYPGFKSIKGIDLANNLRSHAEHYGLVTVSEEVEKVYQEGDILVVKGKINTYKAISVIVATGASLRKLGLDNEDKFIGKGISYCAVCDGHFFKDQEVAVVGGGDTAVEESLYLTKLVKKVYLIHRRDQLRASKILQESLLNNPKVEILWSHAVVGLEGNERLESIKIKNLKTGEEKILNVKGLFIFIGYIPNTQMVDVEKDAEGYIITDELMQTSVPGIFAAGDCRRKILKQVVTAVSDGAIAAYVASKFVENFKNSKKREKIVY